MKNLHDMLLPVVNEIRAGKRSLEVSELWGASKALFLFGLQQGSGRPLIVVTATDEEAETLVSDLEFFNRTIFTKEGQPQPELRMFPTWGLLPFEADSPDSRTVGERMHFLYSLTSGLPGVYVVPAGSLMQKLPPWELFIDSVITIKAASQLDPDNLLASLVSSGYESSSLVTRVGEFSRRGGIVDLFSPLHDQPVRLEFFGDTIESMRSFDPETQRSTGDLPEVVVLPVRELLITDQGRVRFKSRVGDEAINHQLSEGMLMPGAESLAPFFYDMEGLFRYLPPESLIALIEPDDINKMIDEQGQKIETGREEEIEEGRVLPEAAELYLDLKGVRAGLSNFPVLNVPLLGTGAGHRLDTKSAAWLGVRLTKPISLGEEERERESLEGTMAGLVEKLKRLRAESRVAVVCGTDEAAGRLKKLFAEYGMSVVVSDHVTGQETGPWPILVMVNRLSEGFLWQELGLAFITEEEIFGRKVHRPAASRSKVAPFLSSFKELKPGDFVVHTDYGVGEYQGLTHISLDGFETDFLTLRYEPDAKLYVPLYSLDKVQKYIGVEGSAPKLDRLGAPAWAKTKAKVKKDILAMAQELVAIYAAREAQTRAVLHSAGQPLSRIRVRLPL